MRKRLAMLCLIAIAIIGISGCSKTEMESTENRNEIIANYTPTELKRLITDSILKIYMPYSSDDIEEGILLLKDVSTDKFIELLYNSVGTYDEKKEGRIDNLNIDLVNEKNSENRRVKIYISFKYTLDNNSENLLIELICDGEGKIDNMGLWVNY